MKTGIHPAYHDKAKVTCVCGNAFLVGATVPEIHVEICARCHPFYTGESKLIDTAGRVERFKKRQGKVAAPKARKVRVKKEK